MSNAYAIIFAASIKGWAAQANLIFGPGLIRNTEFFVIDKSWFLTLCFKFSPAVGSNDAGNDIITKSASRKSTPDSQLVAVEGEGPGVTPASVHRGDTVASRSGTALSSSASHKMFKSNAAAGGHGGGHKHRTKHHRHHHYGASKSVTGGSTR